MNRKTAVFYAVCTLLCVTLTPFFNKIGGVFGTAVELCAMFLIAIAPYTGYWTLIFAAAAGLLLDIQLSAFFGCNILFYCIFSLLAYRFANMEKNTVIPCILTSMGYVCVKWLFELLIAFFRGFTVDFYAGLVKSVIPGVVQAALVSAVLTWIMLGVHKSTWLRVRERGMGVRYR